MTPPPPHFLSGKWYSFIHYTVLFFPQTDLSGKMTEKHHPRLADEFDLESEDLFFGASDSSPRKEIPKQDQGETGGAVKPNEDQVEMGNRAMALAVQVLLQAEAPVVSPLILPASMSPCPLAHSSPRLIRKESEDGTVEVSE